MNKKNWIKKVSDGQSIILGQLKNCRQSWKLWIIDSSDELTFTINTLSVGQKHPGLQLS